MKISHAVLLSLITITIIIITIIAPPMPRIGLSSPRGHNILGQLGSSNQQQQRATALSNGSSTLIANNTLYVLSRMKSELTTSHGTNTHTGEFNKGIRIAFVKPTFTAAAYNRAFYLFYKKYSHVPHGVNITTDLNLLSSHVTTTQTIYSAFTMFQLIRNLQSITQGSNISILTDTDVDNGSIIFNSSKSNNFGRNKNNNYNYNNAYDIIILGHQEYVTQKEYSNLKKFVANGGTMIILDGNVFYAEVKYDRNNQTVTLVKGHSWAFNGKSAWKSIGERWANETSQWVGSNYFCFRCIKGFFNDPFGYTPHEEQYITNSKDRILLNYNASLPTRFSLLFPKLVIATYELQYQNGTVVALGIYSDDVLSNARFGKYLNNLLLQNDPRTTD
jgi:hypothetical protein